MKLNLLTILFALFATTGFSQSPGNCLHFDGVDDNVTAPLPSIFNNIPGNDFTIEAWVYPEGNTFSRIVFAQLDASNFVSMSIASGNVIYFYVSNTNSQMTNSSIPANQWTHVACTWRGSTGQIEIFFDGVLQSTSGGGTSSTGNNNIMTIGSRTNNAQYFPGRIDELRIWNVARTPCQILGGATTQFITAQTNLIGNYHFNEGTAGGTNTGVTTLPESNNLYTGTLNGFALSGTTSNWIASGATITSNNQQAGVVYGVDTQTSCSPYTWANGTTYSTSNNTATMVFPGGASNGCDSVATLNFTLLQPATGTDVQSSCGAYTWIDGNTYNSSNSTATYTISGGAANGCDSIVTLDLTVNGPTTSTDVQSSCGAYTWIDGNTYSSSNNTATYTYAGAAANGCDSIVTLDLTVNSAVTATDVQSSCGDFTWVDGNTYSMSNNTATFTFTGGAATGCDSIVTLDLTVNTVDVGTTVASNVITADATGAAYQWLDCDNGMSTISGETNATFTPTQNGNYAVEVTQNSCTDTSACVAITTIGLIENTLEGLLNVYPNPTSGVVNMEFSEWQAAIDVRVVSLDGKLVQSVSFENIVSANFELNQPAGVYFIEMSDRLGSKATLRIVKN